MLDRKGLKLKREITSESFSARAEVRRYIDEIAARSPDSEPTVKYWHAARRSTLLLLLTLFGLQYYFFDVFLTIMALPRLTLIAALP